MFLDVIDMQNSKPTSRNPWAWVPTLYLAEGLPYAVVMTVAVIFYKRMGISNTDIAFYTSWLGLPWVIKPLWSPVVDLLRTKRWWIVVMQLIIGAGLGGVALTVPLPAFFQVTLAFFWLLAFSSATHDIAADGFYMLGLNERQQTMFVGVRSTFYRISMITGQGLLIMLAGAIERNTGLPTVDLNVTAKPRAALVEWAQPESLTVTKLDGALRVVSVPGNLEISTEPRPAAQVKELVAKTKAWNLEKGFYSVEKAQAAKNEQAKEPSLWQTSVVQPLEKFLRANFGVKHDAVPRGDLAGNASVVYFHLSQSPGREVVINFGRETGDKSISLVEGARLMFNDQNWNQPAMAVIQLDPKLRTETTAMFRATSGNIPLAWTITFAVLTGLFATFCVYHRFALPYPVTDKSGGAESKNFVAEFFRTFASFFRRNNIGIVLGFLLFYRFAEAQLVKLAAPFLLDTKEVGGMGLTTGQVGFVYGTVGIVCLTLGGLLGGYVAAKGGLKFWLWPMALAINVPNLVYVFLSYTVPDNFWVVNLCVGIEQFGYGFGFTAYMLYLIYISRGPNQTAHYAICTGFMALGMMIPGMFSGWLQDLIGYQHFFVWVMIATLPSFLVVKLIPLDAEFGKKTE